MNFHRIALGCALLATSFASIAGQAYVEIEKQLSAEQLRSVGLSDDQLRLLNQMLRESQARAPAPAATLGAPAVAAGTSYPPVQSEADTSKFIGFNDTPIRAHAEGTLHGWEPGTEFALDNGQRWKVLKGQLNLPKPRDNPEILLVPGIAGRWFLQIDEDMPKARVYRID